MRLMISTVLLICACASFAQTKRDTPWFGGGALMMRTDAVPWPSPEALVRDLRSDDPERRSRALGLLGVEESYTAVDGHDAPEKPESVLLTFQHKNRELALVAVNEPGAMMFAGVAIRIRSSWRRIGAFNCWCKYDLDANVADPLSQFAHFDVDDLVMHASGGGTGVYAQEEARFRISKGRLTEIVRFESRHRNCDPTSQPPSCTLVRRWFVETENNPNIEQAELVTATSSYQSQSLPEIAWNIRELWQNHTAVLTCREYAWDPKRQRFTPRRPAAPCK